jgi:hypothetical protein
MERELPARRVRAGLAQRNRIHRDRAEFERHLAWARAQLAEEAFAALAEEGAQMGVEEALAYAPGVEWL